MTAPSIVLGVTGGIAAYKAVEIVRGLVREGAEVTVVMTARARRFITPLTLQTVSGRRVITSAFPRAGEDATAADVEHIALAREARLLLVAPATADILARLSLGVADDFLTTFHLAVKCPILVAPAMNPLMWSHPTVSEHLARLRGRGVQVIGPDEGAMASPREGPGMGRLADPAAIVAAAMAIVKGGVAASAGITSPLSGRRFLVTAGPTREELDPVRFLSNRSTGRMGYAVAAAAHAAGAEVILISGPTPLAPPAGVQVVRVNTAEEMKQAVMQRLEGIDVVVKTAAVSDFRPARREAEKVKKSGATLTLQLERTPDILAEIGARKGKAFLVGFAAETESLVENSRRKLREKHLDMIVANDVSAEGVGFASDENEVVILEGSTPPQRWPRLAKSEVARRLIALIGERIA